jgi:hypothetical protein
VNGFLRWLVFVLLLGGILVWGWFATRGIEFRDPSAAPSVTAAAPGEDGAGPPPEPEPPADPVIMPEREPEPPGAAPPQSPEPEPPSVALPPAPPPPPPTVPAPAPITPPDQAAAMPDFPWPPAQWSAQAAVPRGVFAASPTLGDAAMVLTAALDRAGYVERSFYRAPGGFALVARLERINADGSPDPSFRFLSPSADEPFDLGTYVQSLFFTPEGFYRQIVFVVSDQPFTSSGVAPTAGDADAILARGATGLAQDIEAAPMSEGHQVIALIYEFKKGAADGDVAILNPGRLGAVAHLAASGIAQALEGR